MKTSKFIFQYLNVLKRIFSISLLTRVATICSIISILGATNANAAIINVPADQPTLTAAVAVAAAGDVIVVSTTANQDPITIDKPLSIIGNPYFRIYSADPICSMGTVPPMITLNGPGSGKVVINGLQTIWAVDCYFPPPVIAGGGFSSLHIHDAIMQAPASGVTGVGQGSPAIAVTALPNILISNSIVIGGGPNGDDCYGSIPGSSSPAIQAASSIVTTLDSTIIGGSGGFNCCEFCGCPADISTKGGAGAPSIISAQILSANSDLTGGTGSEYVAWAGIPFFSTPTSCGFLPDGPAYTTGSYVDLGAGVSVSGTMSIGTSFNLTFPPYSVTQIYGSGYVAPFFLPGFGHIFLNPNGLINLGLFAAPTASTSIPIPLNQTLIGQELAIQPAQVDIVTSKIKMLRPVIKVIMP